MMKLLTTRLSADQAEIVRLLSFFKFMKFFDAPLLDIFESDDEAFSVGYLNFLREADGEAWVSGVIVSSGGYFEPPDEDFEEFVYQKGGQPLDVFVLETMQKVIEDQFFSAVSAEAEATFEYQLFQMSKGEALPF